MAQPVFQPSKALYQADRISSYTGGYSEALHVMNKNKVFQAIVFVCSCYY